MSYINRHIFVIKEIDLLATGQTIIIETETSARFYPFQICIELTSKTGAIVVTPIVRLGSNGTWDNLAALTTMTNLTAVNKMEMPTVIVTDSIDISATGISIDVQTAGTGATVLKAQVIIHGIIL